jgi:putative endonuclease
MSYYVYILQSEKDASFYIGYSEDPKRRLEKHNTSNSGYTSIKKPLKLVYTESYATKREALQREKFLKRQKNTSYYQALIKG